MLSYHLLKNHAGILLCGDYSSLEALHGVIHRVNELAPTIHDREGLFLGLAYDVRKAMERQRQIIKPPEHEAEHGVRYAVEILWPVLLVQARMLREALAYFDSTKLQQAMTFALEHVIETALAEEFPEQSRRLMLEWHQIDGADRDLDIKMHSRGAVFCAWTKAKRRKGLLGILRSFQPMYEWSYQHADQSRQAELISPEEFVRWHDVEWADPRW